MSEPAVKTFDVTPIFNYQRSVEVVKRFTERLTALEALDREDPDRDNFEPLLDYIRDNIKYLRGAVSEIMADDVRLQIATEIFPLRPQFRPHVYTPLSDRDPSCNTPGSALPGSCGGVPDSMAHTL